MTPALSQLMLFIVIVLCGFVVSHAQDSIRILAFMVGVCAMALSIYTYWKNKTN